ncbi:MAG: hypothetical protein ACOYUZ_04805 [Patescibacteria group bacterium]
MMKALLDKAVLFLRRELFKIIVIAFILSAALLLLLEQSYKTGLLCINIAEYMAMGMAFAILTVMTIDYARKIYLIVKQNKK